MASRVEVGLQPKKRVSTYGKAARRHDATKDLFEFAATDESPSTTSAPRNAPTQSSQASAPKDVMLIPKSKEPGRLYSLKNRAESASVTRKPDTDLSPGVIGDEEDMSKSKKRKLGEASSNTTRDAHIAAYSPPSSPPPFRSPKRPSPIRSSPKRATNLKTVKTSTSQSSSSNRAISGKDGALKRPNVEEIMPFSAKTSKKLVNLSVSDGDEHSGEQRIPFRLNRKEQSRVSGPARSNNILPTSKPASKPRSLDPALPVQRKKRMIDALVAQVEESSEEEDEMSEDIVLSPIPRSPPPLSSSTPPQSQSQSSSQPKSAVRQAANAKKPGPKFTYSSQNRTMLAEDSLVDSGGLGDTADESGRMPFLGLGSMIQPSTLTNFALIDEEDETVNTGAVRSLHELRQAGANSRFADEMDDIMQRVGSPTAQPSSLRRGALLELAQKMQEKGFRRQFRSHSGDGNLFQGLGDESDIIAAYAIVSVIITLLSTSTSSLLIQQLFSEGIARLLLKMIEECTDIAAIAKDRKRNVSKHGQSTLASIKADATQLPVWEPAAPTLLSPRTLALKAMDLIMRQTTDPDVEVELFAPTATDQLFAILSEFSKPTCWDFPSNPDAVDFYLALYLLETHSISAMQSQAGTRWTRQYLPTVADVLETALQRGADKFGDLESLAIRLSLNTTNNPDAPGMFVRRGLLRDLAQVACGTFEIVLKSIQDGAFVAKVLESLVFMLGVMINFCEHYPPAAQSLYQTEDEDVSSLDRLIRLFLDYHSTTADADSMEKTQLNVAFGYLSIVLGYLCIDSRIRDRFTTIYGKESLEPLLTSLREFIIFHQVAANAVDGESGSKPESSASERLKALVSQLEFRY